MSGAPWTEEELSRSKLVSASSEVDQNWIACNLDCDILPVCQGMHAHMIDLGIAQQDVIPYRVPAATDHSAVPQLDMSKLGPASAA